MNREKAKQLLPVIQAYAEGKTIQTKRIDGTWVDFEPQISKDIGINFENGEHRVKPEENHTIKQNTIENLIKGVVSISGSVDTFRCWKCGRTLPISERTNFVYASNPPKYSCKECEGIKKEKQYRPFKDCNELIEHYQKKYKSAIGCDIYFPSLYKPSIWVKSKCCDACQLLITGYSVDDEKKSVVWLTDSWITLEKLFDDFVFLDDSPCGLEE